MPKKNSSRPTSGRDGSLQDELEIDEQLKHSRFIDRFAAGIIGVVVFFGCALGALFAIVLIGEMIAPNFAGSSVLAYAVAGGILALSFATAHRAREAFLRLRFLAQRAARENAAVEPTTNSRSEQVVSCSNGHQLPGNSGFKFCPQCGNPLEY